MKIQSTALHLLSLLAIGLSLCSAHAAEKKVAGPNGGRIISTVEPRAEFFVTPERKVQITFLDASGKPLAPANQTVTVTAGERSAPRTLTFAKSGNTLLSTAAIPLGDAVPTVVQIKTAPNSATVTERFNLELSKCEECKLAEYACICAH